MTAAAKAKPAKKETTNPLKQFKITAVIPTVQYGNMQPEYTIEAPSFEEAHKIALPYIEQLWGRYCAKGSELKIKNIEATSDVVYEKLDAVLTGNSIMFAGSTHHYKSEKSEHYTSGSKFCKQFVPQFDPSNILPAMAKKHDLSEELIAATWKLKGDVSSSLGTAIHGALELYGKYREIGEKIGSTRDPVVNTVLHDHPILKPIVEAFFKGREKEDALYEAAVVDDERLLVGQLDRVLIVNRDKKICRVQDFKTNADINKPGFKKWMLAPFENTENTPLNNYWLQLSFYGNILEKHGWTVQGLDIFAFDSKWTTYSHDMIDLNDLI